MATIVGVDRHKHVLSAVALDDRGGVLGNWNGAMSARSLSKLLGWAAELTPDATWARTSSTVWAPVRFTLRFQSRSSSA